MSTDGASSPSRLLPRLLGVLLLIMGLALLAGGVKLSMLGGALYYLLAGIGITPTGVLSVAVVLAGATALASQFTTPGEMVKTGQLDRDAVPGMASAAPTQADGDWNSYGRSAFGDRYSPLAQITPENAHKLVPACTYRTGDIPGPG